jgi:hypothetical protein
MNQAQMEKTFGGPVVVGTPRRSAKSGWLWRAAEPHLWCSYCSRTFPNGIYRRGESAHHCPYADCDGDVAQDTSEWQWIRRMHPDYPLAPWLGIRYPVNVAQLGRTA